jgi:hypothetical protein
MTAPDPDPATTEAALRARIHQLETQRDRLLQTMADAAKAGIPDGAHGRVGNTRWRKKDGAILLEDLPNHEEPT